MPACRLADPFLYSFVYVAPKSCSEAPAFT